MCALSLPDRQEASKWQAESRLAVWLTSLFCGGGVGGCAGGPCSGPSCTEGHEKNANQQYLHVRLPMERSSLEDRPVATSAGQSTAAVQVLAQELNGIFDQTAIWQNLRGLGFTFFD